MRPLRRHLAYLDGLRGLSALYVVLHHALLQSWPTAPILAGMTNWHTGWLRIFQFGPYAVTAFIAISGFSLGLPIARGTHVFNTRLFFLKRIRRILPPYYAVIILAVIASRFIHHADLVMYQGSLPHSPWDLATHFLLIHNLWASTHTTISGQLWSIAVECQIYLFFPLLVWAWEKWGAIAAFWISAGLMLVSLAVTAVTHAGLPGPYFVVFGLGLYFCDRALNSPIHFGRFVVVAGIASLIMLPTVGPAGIWPKLANLAVGLWASALMAYCFVTPGSWVNRALSFRLLASVGLFSYSLYLVHFTAQQVLWERFVYPLHVSRLASFTLMATIGTVAILALSYLFFLAFEKPLLSTKQKLAVLAAEAAA